MSGLLRIRLALLGAVTLASACVSTMQAGDVPPTVAQRRAAIVEAARQGPAAIPQLARALDDENALVRRAAARALADMGDAAATALAAGLDNSDALVRRVAVQALAARQDTASVALLEKAIRDPAEEVRQATVTALAGMRPRTAQIVQLLQIAQKDKAASVRGPAVAALWPYHRDVVLFRDRPDVADMVANVKVIQTIRLPKEDWSFKTDPDETGHLKDWFDPKLNDKDWVKIPIEKLWDDSGIRCEGVAWYRRRFALPAREPYNAAEIHFDAVDESAWVWINGVYAGQHDLGPAGYNRPFALDVTDMLHWGEENQITVRVLNAEGAGGIWKPVRIETLKQR